MVGLPDYGGSSTEVADTLSELMVRADDAPFSHELTLAALKSQVVF